MEVDGKEWAARRRRTRERSKEGEKCSKKKTRRKTHREIRLPLRNLLRPNIRHPTRPQQFLLVPRVAERVEVWVEGERVGLDRGVEEEGGGDELFRRGWRGES
jgi:hypothetical protein